MFNSEAFRMTLYKHHISYIQAAKLLGVHAQTIANCANGRTTPSYWQAVQSHIEAELAKLGIDISFTDDMPVEPPENNLSTQNKE